MKIRSLVVAKRPCDCYVGQFWPRYNWKRIFCIEPYRSIFNHCGAIDLEYITQNKSYYTVQGYSRSPMWVPIESPYATSC